MIYLDNAATTLQKPKRVAEAVVRALGTLGNSARGAHSGAMDAARGDGAGAADADQDKRGCRGSGHPKSPPKMRLKVLPSPRGSRPRSMVRSSPATVA